MDLENICKEVCILARETGSYIREQASLIRSKDVELKGYNNFVTHVDKESEKRLTKGLSKLLPGAAFIAEENTVEQSLGTYTWIVDPLDGTTNFIHGLPIYSISIALMFKGIIVSGVVYEITHDECFYAWENSPAYLNGKQIKVSDAVRLSDALLVTGFPYYEYDRLDKYIELFVYVLKNTHGLRRLGSAAADLAYVACGRFELFFEYGLSPWDVAAGSLIVKQAGGKVSDFRGENDFIFGKEIIASNNFVFNEFLSITRHIFG